ncbi:MAG: bifunctional diguanylate cyclase/phosphodiesterase [Usitatibacter sp.]
MKTYRRPHQLALAALACGLAATLFAWFAAGREVERESSAEFASRATLAASLLERRVERYVDVLYGLAALAHHDPTVTRKAFMQYAVALDLPRRFPGVKVVEFIRRVPADGRDAFIAATRDDRSLSPDGYPGFDIRPPGQRDEYWVIDYMDPRTGNEPVFGLDIRTLGVASDAAARARDTGEPAGTARYRLAQEKGTSHGLVIYLPVYGAQTPRSVEERRASLRGFVNVVMRMDDVLADMLSQPIFSGLRMRINDVGAAGGATVAPDASTLLYRTALGTRDPEPGWLRAQRSVQRPLVVAGRQWRLQFDDEPAMNPWLRPLPLTALFGGVAISILLFGILYAIARTRSEAVGLAAEATRELRAQLSFTQQLIEAMPNPVFFKDREGRYLGCNRAFEKFVGEPRDELIGRTVRDIAGAELAGLTEAADEALLAGPGAQSYETSMVHGVDGLSHDVIVSKASLVDPSGKIAGLVGVLVDITERKKLEGDARAGHERLRAVIRAAPVAIIDCDLDDVVRMWNPAAERIFGWREDEMLGKPLAVVPDELREETRALRERAQAGEIVWIEETQRLCRDGRLIDASITLAPVYDAEGRVNGTLGTVIDVSPRKRAEAALRESEAQLRLAMDAAQLGMWYWECDTDRFTYSEGLNALFGRPGESQLVDYRVLKERLHPEDRELFDAAMRHSVKEGDDFQVDFRVVWPDGSVHWVANRGQVHRGPDGRAKRVIGVAMNITERKLAEQRIAHMAHHDALTGLPNRVLLRDRIQQAIAQAHRGGSQLAVLFLDLDRFKTINDSLGHQLGDRLLQSVASRLLVCVREGDTVARVGGDEFVIVIPGIGAATDASAVASKILEVLSAAFHLHGNDLHVAASIGISLYPADGSDAETLMRNADTAMYHAKDSGRANYQFFTQHMNVQAQQRLTLETSLRRALDNDEFELHYQPLFDLRDRSVTGFEALLRWRPPGGAALVMPGEFIGAAEESGIIVALGEWVLHEALHRAKNWQSPGRPLTISVNVSANQLARPSFVEGLRALVAETGIDPGLVELEVTEGVIIEGAGDAREALFQVAALGVGIAIDDFGTGYSGLAYLKRLPIDTVKIDQSFVRDLTVDPDDAAIVTAIVAMSRSLGIDVVAEGVESEEQLEALKRLGCQRAQGFLLARPMTAANVVRFLGRATSAAAG